MSLNPASGELLVLDSCQSDYHFPRCKRVLRCPADASSACRPALVRLPWGSSPDEIAQATWHPSGEYFLLAAVNQGVWRIGKDGSATEVLVDPKHVLTHRVGSPFRFTEDRVTYMVSGFYGVNQIDAGGMWSTYRRFLGYGKWANIGSVDIFQNGDLMINGVDGDGFSIVTTKPEWLEVDKEVFLGTNLPFRIRQVRALHPYVPQQ
eukprot:CAMPEP_0204608406 /NCGR_PEP_ID=MMETSP0661-20131031/60294_1 /ASSEMBLY_ACC=CAM_ASM_000606 /TAXON_ID=109239 /ORGANISM="Alexandrium margalefi, Strain AMGDE01CS-322" /LENGTH=205 /DNA_ID=CAMNT_0051619915 /DNA_START=93 /DNA_END=710 /DNA_ORIENTATION=+